MTVLMGYADKVSVAPGETALDLCAGQPNAFADHATCLSTCAGFSTAEKYDASDIDGDTFACRLYHLTAASTNPDLHCAHIGAVSPVCL